MKRAKRAVASRDQPQAATQPAVRLIEFKGISHESDAHFTGWRPRPTARSVRSLVQKQVLKKPRLKRNQQKRHLPKKQVLTLKKRMLKKHLTNKFVFWPRRWESENFEYKCFFVFAVGKYPVGSVP